MTETHEIAKSNNKALEQRLLKSIKEVPNLQDYEKEVLEFDSNVIKTVNDEVFNLQTDELSPTQKYNFKKLIDEI